MRFLKTFIFLILQLTVFTSVIESQNSDSLKNLLKTAKHDTTRIILMSALTDYETDIKKFVAYNDQLRAFAELCLKNNQTLPSSSPLKKIYLEYLAKSINNSASFANDEGDVTKATELFHQSLKIYEEIGDNEGIQACFNQLGTIYVQSGNNAKGTDYFTKALKMAEKANHLRGMLDGMNNLAVLATNSGNIPRALELFEKCLPLAQKINDKSDIIVALSNIGVVYRQTGNHAKALEYHAKSLKLAEELKDKEKIAMTLSNLAREYDNIGDIPKALESYHRALSLREEINNKEGIAIALSNIATIYSTQGEPVKASEFYKRSLKMMEELGNKFGVAGALNNIGLLYKQQHDLVRSLECYTKSLQLYQEIDHKEGISSALNNIGSIHKKKGELDEALKCYLKANDINQSIGHQREISTTLNNIGATYFEMGNTAKALEYGIRSLKIGRELGYPEKISTAASLLRSVYKKQNNSKMALEMYELYILMRDSINNKQTRKASVKKQLQYDYDRKAAADSIKSAEQIVQGNIKHELAIKQQRIYTYGGGIGFAFMLVIAGVSFRAYRNKQKANLIISEQKQVVEKQKAEVELQKDVIEAQKHLVEEHQKDIIDSITYAKRLQEAILPPQKLVSEFLPDNFIMYLPKDIVAGDFFWMETLSDGTILIAAADSTGHGVPGAMVSLVCSNALNRAVKEFNLKETGKILDKTRELVLETFAKSEGEVKDGMDVSLLSINKIKNEINWSGANNQLWYTQNGTLQEITANKQPIGKTENPAPFTTHSIGWSEGTIFYLMTDGYPDQFGGPKGKKFKYKQLEDILVSNAAIPLSAQKELLANKFSEWKGGLEQVDDVTIIGIKI